MLEEEEEWDDAFLSEIQHMEQLHLQRNQSLNAFAPVTASSGPAVGSAQSFGSLQATGTAAAGERWNCRSCTLENDSSRASCLVCGTPKGQVYSDSSFGNASANVTCSQSKKTVQHTLPFATVPRAAPATSTSLATTTAVQPHQPVPPPQQQQQQPMRRPPFHQQTTLSSSTTVVKSRTSTIQSQRQHQQLPPPPGEDPQAKTRYLDLPLEECMEIDAEAAKTWVYPTNYSVRTYQRSITERALYHNTLVSLPTGLGKTLIASVVMYNFYRWFPTGKIVFMAPTKPLVTQQIKACHEIMGIPLIDTAELQGEVRPTTRRLLWQTKRVFFCTPQSILNDLRQRVCRPEKFVCVVVDEAHRATGNYAYCGVIQEILLRTRFFRVLALSATPGSKFDSIQQVLQNLQISHIESRTADDPDVSTYTHARLEEVVKCSLTSQITEVKALFYKLFNKVTQRLCMLNIIQHRDPDKMTRYGVLLQRDRFRKSPQYASQRHAECDLALLVSLLHTKELLLAHGMGGFKKQIDAWVEESQSRSTGSNSASSITRYKRELVDSEEFKALVNHLHGMGNLQSPGGTPNAGTNHPKLLKLREVLTEHFDRKNRGQGESTRAIVFTQFRDSVVEIVDLLTPLAPLIKVQAFVGQGVSKAKESKGQSQKMQQQIVKKFRQGLFNVLVATCIAEEGLDIGEVDLIVSFDVLTSAVRTIQRMGRTGRKRVGRVVTLVTEGEEEKKLQRSIANARTVARALTTFKNKFKYCLAPRMIPNDLTPVYAPLAMEIPEFHASQVAGKSTGGPGSSSSGSSPSLRQRKLLLGFATSGLDGGASSRRWQLTEEELLEMKREFAPPGFEHSERRRFDPWVARFSQRRLAEPPQTFLVPHSKRSHMLRTFLRQIHGIQEVVTTARQQEEEPAAIEALPPLPSSLDQPRSESPFHRMTTFSQEEDYYDFGLSVHDVAWSPDVKDSDALAVPNKPPTAGSSLGTTSTTTPKDLECNTDTKTIGGVNVQPQPDVDAAERPVAASTVRQQDSTAKQSQKSPLVMQFRQPTPSKRPPSAIPSKFPSPIRSMKRGGKQQLKEVEDEVMIHGQRVLKMLEQMVVSGEKQREDDLASKKEEIVQAKPQRELPVFPTFRRLVFDNVDDDEVDQEMKSPVKQGEFKNHQVRDEEKQSRRNNRVPPAPIIVISDDDESVTPQKEPDTTRRFSEVDADQEIDNVIDVHRDGEKPQPTRSEAWEQTRSEHLDHQTQDEEKDEACCAVCGEKESYDDDPIVFCDRCDVAVHQFCYGIASIPQGDWFCEPCSANEQVTRIKCALCPLRGGAFKRTQCKQWAHVQCFMWIPELHLADSEVLTLGTLATLDPDRSTLDCVLCHSKSTRGIIQCAYKRCLVAFHVSCAYQARYRLVQEEVENYTVFVAYCPMHASEAHQRTNHLALPPGPALPSSTSATPPAVPKSATMNHSQQPVEDHMQTPLANRRQAPRNLVTTPVPPLLSPSALLSPTQKTPSAQEKKKFRRLKRKYDAKTPSQSSVHSTTEPIGHSNSNSNDNSTTKASPWAKRMRRSQKHMNDAKNRLWDRQLVACYVEQEVDVRKRLDLSDDEAEYDDEEDDDDDSFIDDSTQPMSGMFSPSGKGSFNDKSPISTQAVYMQSLDRSQTSPLPFQRRARFGALPDNGIINSCLEELNKIRRNGSHETVAEPKAGKLRKRKRHEATGDATDEDEVRPDSREPPEAKQHPVRTSTMHQDEDDDDDFEILDDEDEPMPSFNILNAQEKTIAKSTVNQQQQTSARGSEPLAKSKPGNLDGWVQQMRQPQSAAEKQPGAQVQAQPQPPTRPPLAGHALQIDVVRESAGHLSEASDNAHCTMLQQPPPATSSDGVTQEERDRIERNRQKALERMEANRLRALQKLQTKQQQHVGLGHPETASRPNDSLIKDSLPANPGRVTAMEKLELRLAINRFFSHSRQVLDVFQSHSVDVQVDWLESLEVDLLLSFRVGVLWLQFDAFMELAQEAPEDHLVVLHPRVQTLCAIYKRLVLVVELDDANPSHPWIQRLERHQILQQQQQQQQGQQKDQQQLPMPRIIVSNSSHEIVRQLIRLTREEQAIGFALNSKPGKSHCQNGLPLDVNFTRRVAFFKSLPSLSYGSAISLAFRFQNFDVDQVPVRKFNSRHWQRMMPWLSAMAAEQVAAFCQEQLL